MRAAASSIASGNPSVRSQIAHTAAAFLCSQLEVGGHHLGAIDEKPDGLDIVQCHQR
ncbi:MAG: hypothetical protein M3Q50_11065 [Chloroflexota bacterium]|nr:hypothetical protein [Chloroflexota bacterium]